MANPGMPEPARDGGIPPEFPPRRYPGERPLGSDEPSAPFEEPAEPGLGSDDLPGEPPGGRADLGDRA